MLININNCYIEYKYEKGSDFSDPFFDYVVINNKLLRRWPSQEEDHCFCKACSVPLR